MWLEFVIECGDGPCSKLLLMLFHKEEERATIPPPVLSPGWREPAWLWQTWHLTWKERKEGWRFQCRAGGKWNGKDHIWGKKYHGSTKDLTPAGHSEVSYRMKTESQNHTALSAPKVLPLHPHLGWEVLLDTHPHPDGPRLPLNPWGSQESCLNAEPSSGRTGKTRAQRAGRPGLAPLSSLDCGKLSEAFREHQHSSYTNDFGKQKEKKHTQPVVRDWHNLSMETRGGLPGKEKYMPISLQSEDLDIWRKHWGM